MEAKFSKDMTLKERISYYFDVSSDNKLLLQDILGLIDEIKKELLENPRFNTYEEIAVPEAWEPWFEKYFGKLR